MVGQHRLRRLAAHLYPHAHVAEAVATADGEAEVLEEDGVKYYARDYSTLDEPVRTSPKRNLGPSYKVTDDVPRASWREFLPTSCYSVYLVLAPLTALRVGCVSGARASWATQGSLAEPCL